MGHGLGKRGFHEFAADAGTAELGLDVHLLNKRVTTERPHRMHE